MGSQLPRRFQIANLTAIGWFFLMLCTPTVVSLFRLSPQPLTENRRLAAFPEPPRDLPSATAWPDGFEKYYNDHFGFRNQLVRWNNYLQFFGLNTFPGRHITVGQKGWLYLPADGFSNTYNSVTTFDSHQVSYWQNTFQEHAHLCARLGIRYLVVIAANKQSVYPDYLPERYRKTLQPDAFDRFLRQLNLSVDVLDSRPLLRQARNQFAVYSQTDSHWNARGAFLVAQQIVERLRPDFPALVPMDRSNYREEIVTQQPGGDLARLVGLADRIREDEIGWERDPKSGIEVTKHIVAVSGDSSASITVSQSENSRNRGGCRAVLTSDSFGPSLMHLLTDSFYQIVNFGPPYPLPKGYSRSLEAVLNQEKPDVFIEEMAERRVGDVPSEKLICVWNRETSGRVTQVILTNHTGFHHFD